MFEEICVIGERGQITIPKPIRELKGIKTKDKLKLGFDGKKITIEVISKKRLKEGYKEFADTSKSLAKEGKNIDKEMDVLIGEY